MNTRFIVKTAAYAAPASRKWQHPRRRVAVLEVLPEGPEPKMISSRARGVVRVVRVWEDLYAGPSDHCQYAVALRLARELAERLSAGGVL